jgi:hypothetical protein
MYRGLMDKHPVAQPILSSSSSSQTSLPRTFPSPQIGEQVEAVEESPPVQDHPSTFPEQSTLHLSAPL